MSRENGSRAQSTVNGGIQRFDPREDEATTIHLSSQLEEQAVSGFLNPVIPSDSHRGWDCPEESDQRAPFYVAGIHSQMTLALFVETKFLPEHVQYKSPAGQTHYQAILKHVMTPEAVSRIFDPEQSVKLRLTAIQDWPYLDSIRLCDLRSEHIRRIVSAADRAGYSAQTVKHIKNVCFAIIAHAQKEGCFSGPNPASLVKLPRIVHNASPGLTTDQIEALLDLLQYPYREVALFVLTTGLGLPEICDLRWNNLNLDDFERFTDGQFLPARTALVKSWWNRGGLGDSRTCHKNRIIEIREPLLSALRRVRERNSTPDAEDCVLTAADGNQIMPQDFRVREMKRVGKALGMQSFGWQDLRRTHQAFQAQSLSQRSLSIPLRPASIRTSSPSMQALSRQEPLSQDKLKSVSTSPRTFCFGQRLRAGSESETSIDNHRGGQPTRLII